MSWMSVELLKMLWNQDSCLIRYAWLSAFCCHHSIHIERMSCGNWIIGKIGFKSYKLSFIHTKCSWLQRFWAINLWIQNSVSKGIDSVEFISASMRQVHSTENWNEKCHALHTAYANERHYWNICLRLIAIIFVCHSTLSLAVVRSIAFPCKCYANKWIVWLYLTSQPEPNR